MKRMTASEIRQNWFRVLDQVAEGEVVVLERKGRRLVVMRQDEETESSTVGIPDYSDVISSPDADGADEWTWHWDEATGGIQPG